VILPLFAFMNTGVSLEGLSLDSFTASIPLGIALGLFLGNQIGVLGFSWITVKLGLARMPDNVSWLSLYGVASLCGIGFTMSLFISSLAFEQGGSFAVDDRLGILLGSILSALYGYAILKVSLNRSTTAEP
jgi:NhaA family Na+:H+ antiporter